MDICSFHWIGKLFMSVLAFKMYLQLFPWHWLCLWSLTLMSAFTMFIDIWIPKVHVKPVYNGPSLGTGTGGLEGANVLISGALAELEATGNPSTAKMFMVSQLISRASVCSWRMWKSNRTEPAAANSAFILDYYHFWLWCCKFPEWFSYSSLVRYCFRIRANT